MSIGDPSTSPPWLVNTAGSLTLPTYFTATNPAVINQNQGANVGAFYINVVETDTSYATSNFTTFCVDLNRDIYPDPNSLGNQNTNLPYTVSPLDQKLAAIAGTSAANAGRIAYLFNHHGQDSLTASQAAGLQLAIWELEYDNSPVDVTLGNFFVGGATDPGAVVAANAYVLESLGKSEKAAFLDGLPTLNSQGLIATNSFNFDNKFAPPGSLSGFVYADANNNGTKDTTEVGIPNIPVTVTTLVAGVPVVVGSTTTGPDGSYSVANLPAGTYTVTEGAVPGYLPDVNNTGTIASVTVTAGNDTPNNNFGEIKPVTVAGTVYEDKDVSGTLNGGDVGIGGVTLTLTNSAGTTVASTTTAANGTYLFTTGAGGQLLPPDTYKVTESQPTGYLQGTNTVGTVNSTTDGSVSTSVDVISSIALAQGQNSINNNFGEIKPVTVAGTVYSDNDNNGSLNAGDTGIGGVSLSLTNAAGTVIATTTTAANGTYSFTATSAGQPIAPGTYKVTETQPSGYLQGTNAVGTVNGTTDGSLTGIDMIGSIVLASGQNSVANNFGEIKPVTVAGTVYSDNDNSGTFNTGDTGIGGVSLSLTNSAGAVIATTTTASNGTYSFTTTTAGQPIAPGTYKVTETQPFGYLQGTNAVGTVNGTSDGSLTGIDMIGSIVLAAGQNSINNNFGEIKPVTIAGTVYSDNDANGSLNGGDTGIGGVSLSLTNSAGAVIATTTTAADGTYAFTTTSTGQAISPGTYKVTETQPFGYLQGTNTVGTVGGTTDGSLTGTDMIGSIVLAAGQNSINNNFGEIKPVTVAGTVYQDKDNSGSLTTGDLGIGGVSLSLTNTAGTVIATTTTASNGTYAFTTTTAGQPIPAGTYKVTESQPAPYLQGSNTVGTVNGTIDGSLTGTDMIGSIVLKPGQASVSNNFGEILPVSISGTAYIDATGNGLTSLGSPLAGDTVESGVKITLTGTTLAGASVTQTAYTDANGNYSFNGLAPGNYSVSETTPTGYVETAPTSFVYNVAATTQGASYPNNNFANFMSSCCTCALSNVIYKDNGCTIPGLRGNTNQGDTVSVTFTVPRSVTSETLTLVAYAAPSASFSAQNASQQQIVSIQTGTFTPGTYTLTVTLPKSFYQVDFVCGSAITTFGPADSNIFYGAQNRLIDADNDGKQVFTTSSLSGYVYLDNNGNSTFGTGDTGLANVPVTLNGTTWAGVAVSIPTVSSSTGYYSFPNLAPGTYSITETLPAGYTSQVADQGTNGGVLAVGSVSSIGLNSNTVATGYNFGEVSSRITGTVYVDAIGNGLTTANVPPAGSGDTVEGGVTVNLYNTNYQIVASTVTAADGTYSFNNVPLGTYGIAEVAPNGQYQTGPNALYYVVTTSSSSPNSSGNNFSNYVGCDMSGLTNVKYFVNGKQVSGLQGKGSQGATVTVTFNVAANSSPIELSLVGYNAPASYYTSTNVSQQVISSVSTGTFAPGPHTLTITLPKNYYQVDFVCGAPLSQLEANGSHVDYQYEGRLINYDNGGTTAPASSCYAQPTLGFNQTDVGNVNTPGTLAYTNGTYTLTASGDDIWNNADAFNYDYQALNGNGTIITRVTGISNTDSWTKAGIMIRQSLDPGSAQASVFATPGNGVVFQDRTTANDISNNWGASNSFNCGSTTPVYLKLVRSGNTFSAYDSSNGTNWTFIGSDTISMTSQVYVGLALTSHNNGAVATASFDNVKIS